MKVTLKHDIIRIDTTRKETVFYITRKNGNKEMYIFPNRFKKEIAEMRKKLGVE